MTAVGVEVVARSVQIDGQQVDRLPAVLVMVSQRLDQEHLLSQPLGSALVSSGYPFQRSTSGKGTGAYLG